MDAAKVKSGLRQGLREDYYLIHREWPYRDIPRKIICEKYMEDMSEKDTLTDYKFFCFNGKVKCFKIDYDRFTAHKANYYAPDKTLLRFGEKVCPPDYSREVSIPDNIDNMIQLAEKLSADHPFLRVDFYNVNGKIYFGELTFFPASGFGPFIPEEWDETLGSWLTLPDVLK